MKKYGYSESIVRYLFAFLFFYDEIKHTLISFALTGKLKIVVNYFDLSVGRVILIYNESFLYNYTLR